MSISWRHSISSKILFAMAIVLMLSLASGAVSVFVFYKFNLLSNHYSQSTMPELGRTSDLKIAMLKLRTSMRQIQHSQNLVEHRIIINELNGNIHNTLMFLERLDNAERKAAIHASLATLKQIVASFNEENTGRLTAKRQLQTQLEQLDKTFITLLQNTELNNEQRQLINQLYRQAKNLAAVTNRFKFNLSKDEITTLIADSDRRINLVNEFVGFIEHPDNGVIAMLERMDTFTRNLAALDAKTDILMEQLNLDVSYYFAHVRKLALSEADNLSKASSQSQGIVITLISFSAFVTATLMMLFHQKITKRLMHIARYIHDPQKHHKLENISLGDSEISYIAKSLYQYIEDNERQKNEITTQFEQLHAIVDNANQAIFIIRAHEVIYQNKQCTELFEQNPEILDSDLKALLEAQLDDGGEYARICFKETWYLPFHTRILWQGEQAQLVMLNNISDQVETETELLSSLTKAQDEAYLDAMTGLYNRRKLVHLFEQHAGDDYTMLVADIDWFKGYNDYYGHGQGDECIQAVAKTIKNNLRSDDYAFRYGGEEFVIVLFNHPKEAACGIGKRIMRELSEHAILHEKSEFGYVTLSIGIAHVSEAHGNSWEQVFEVADERLYEAKHKGRNLLVSASNRDQLKN